MNLDKFNIGKGAAIGVLFGYFVSLRFGPIIGVVLGFLLAVITTNVKECILAMMDVCKTFQDLRKSIREGVACFRKKMEEPLEKIVDALTGFSPFIWVGTLFFCIGILENVYLGITTHVGGNGPKNALFVNGASFVWLLVPLITYASWPKAHEIHAKSGPLSWPLYKLFTLGAKKIGEWAECLSAKELPLARTLADGVVCLIPERFELWDRVAEWFELNVESPNKAEGVPVVRPINIFAGLIASILGMLVFAIIPVIAIIVTTPFVVVIAILILDLFVMVFLRIACSKSLAAGVGAASGTALEYALFPSFNPIFTEDYLRCVIFMIIGAGIGIGTYCLRNWLEKIRPAPEARAW